MRPLDLIMGGAGIMGAVGDSLDGGQAGQPHRRAKELIGGGLVLLAGTYFALREHSFGPLLLALVVVAVLIGIHEFSAKKLPPKEADVLQGPWGVAG